MKVPRRAPTPRPTGRNRARPAAGRGAARPAPRAPRSRVPAEPAPVVVRPPGSAPRSYFTRRAVVFALVLFAVAISVAYPAQRYVAQRQSVDDLRMRVAAGTERVDELEKAVAAAGEPYAIEREARRRLHYVMPGEEAFRVTDPMTVIEEQKAAAAAKDRAWWDAMLASVTEASTPIEALPVGPAAGTAVGAAAPAD